jgi:anthranilate synthase component 1
MESSDYHGARGSWSYVCAQPIATFKVENHRITETFPNGNVAVTHEKEQIDVVQRLNLFRQAFLVEGEKVPANGIFGYIAYDAIEHFETIKLSSSIDESRRVPEVFYSFYRFIIAIDHFHNQLIIIENVPEDENSKMAEVETLLLSRTFAVYPFKADNKEVSNMTDEEYIDMVKKGKESCLRGDVFQIVLSRRFSQTFTGDDFNVYRSLRSINPSPYLFYFDYGSFRIFGSSPEAQLEICEGKAFIHPIAGTFKRTGDDEYDKQLALQLSQDKKENAEHVMLVDLARNDLSKNATDVKVETYREIQFYSHVLHMVSVVSGKLSSDYNPIKVLADSFPAGTLSGAPKYKAMELIDKYEGNRRGYYGGCLGYLGFDGTCNHAIMIRSFLSKNNTLFYQAGAGIVQQSKEENELAEVNNKLAALKQALIEAEQI